MQCLLELSWLLLSAVGPFAAKFCVLDSTRRTGVASLGGHGAAKKECFLHGVVALSAQPNLPRVAWLLRLPASGNPVLSHPFVTGSEEADGTNPVTALESWRPRRDLNPCYRRERALAYCKQRNLQGSGRSCMYRKSPLRTLGHRYCLYRPCTARNHQARSRASF